MVFLLRKLSLYKGCVFGEAEHRLLRDILGGIKGKFLLSYNDCEFVRGLYKGFNVEAVRRHNNLAARYEKDAKFDELLIRNY